MNVMLGRRMFFKNSLMAGLVPFLPLTSKNISSNGSRYFDESTRGSNDIFNKPLPVFERKFIAHRGVHLERTIAGENSIESIRYAARAGFSFVEFDVQLTSDDQFVVMHDATLNRTVLDSEGQELPPGTLVSRFTLGDLKSKFILKAAEPQNRTKIPSMEEFLIECRRQLLVPFIEVKPKPFADGNLRKLIDIADSVCGKNNYIITSNNDVNRQLRRLGYNGVMCMGILYQSSFDEIKSWGNCIMAISATRILGEKYRQYVRQCKQLGILTESSANNFGDLRLTLYEGIDIISTDFISPDVLQDFCFDIDLNSEVNWSDFDTNGMLVKNTCSLNAGDFLRLNRSLSVLYFGSVHVIIEFSGAIRVRLSDYTEEIHASEIKEDRYQLLFYKKKPDMEITALEKTIIKSIRFQVRSL